MGPMPETDSPDKPTPTGHIPRILWLTTPIWFVLLIEFTGAIHYDRNPIHVGRFRDGLVFGTLALVVISPFLLMFINSIMRTQKGMLRRRTRTLVFLILTLAWLATMFSCVWSCGGHPTWASPYAY